MPETSDKKELIAEVIIKILSKKRLRLAKMKF